jgi:hypothetical protein
MNTYTTNQRTSHHERISRTATIRLKAGVAEVFPLFGPIREMEWAFGWQPEVLYPTSASVEEKMIFRTSGIDGLYTWVVTKYDPIRFLVEYSVHTASRVWFITVSCRAEAGQTLALVTYTYTSMTESGAALNHQSLTEMFRHDLRDWEEAINHYLLTGRQLQPERASLT